jgi:hypothetical protein
MATTRSEFFRAGNKTSARLDRPRLGPTARDDLDTRLIGGVPHVDPQSGGVSVFTYPNAAVAGPWHRLPAGTSYDDTLLCFRVDDPTDPTHWVVEPALMR